MDSLCSANMRYSCRVKSYIDEQQLGDDRAMPTRCQQANKRHKQIDVKKSWVAQNSDSLARAAIRKCWIMLRFDL